MQIYTKTGDKGETSLFGGGRVSKTSIRIDAIGSIDELNSTLGIIAAELEIIESKEIIKLRKLLIREQRNMIRAGADLATRYEVNKKFEEKVNRIKNSDIKTLEKEIDTWDQELTKLTKFLLPGGTKASALTHHARSVCRRVERIICHLAGEDKLNENLVIYINRLSDWLFQFARYINLLEGKKDILA